MASPSDQEEIVLSDSEHREGNGGYSVADLSRTKSLSRQINRARAGSTLKRADAAWYVFDNLSCDQAEDLLWQHGNDGTYLVSHFHDPESYGMSIRVSERGQVVYKHYAIGISGKEFHVEGIAGHFPTIEAVVEAVSMKINERLVPIFHKFNESTSDFTLSEDCEAPPDYKQAEKFPAAAQKSLPKIIPVYPTLRRIMQAASLQRDQHLGNASELPEEISLPEVSTEQRSCCWKAFHTDVNGKWWKPHKAGPVTAILLVIGWILFIVFFGWIVLMALILVAILICFSYCCNYICTGKCQIEDEESEREQARISTTPGGVESNWRPPVTTGSIMNQLQEQEQRRAQQQQ